MKKPSFKLTTSILIICFCVLFAIPALINNKQFIPKFLENNIVRLGLDLQGGSQLLLEIDYREALKEKMQNFSEDVIKKIQENQINLNKVEILESRFTINLVKAIDDDTIDALLADFKDINFSLNGKILEISYKDSFLKQLYSSILLQSLEIVRKRIDEVGTNEPIIQVQGKNRILVQLPGLNDPDRVKSLLGKTAKMNFRMVDEKAMASVNEKKYFIGSELIDNQDSTVSYVIRKRIGVSGDNLVDASASVDQYNQPIVSIRFDSLGSRKFADLTAKNVGKRFAIVLDKKVISAPVIREAIPTGNAQISGNFTFETANDLAILLRAGSLPAPLTIVEERSVGPSLGQDSINAGSISILIALSLVLIYMYFIYGNFGLIANFVLIINFLFIIAWLVILEATLTLPGIAGIALTVGMAVDANVLIFERIREEKLLGRSKISSVNTGFEQALRAILDANVTTLIAALILFFLGSGPIRGFSITLGLGVLSTIICTMIISRQLIDYYYIKNNKRELEI